MNIDEAMDAYFQKPGSGNWGPGSFMGLTNEHGIFWGILGYGISWEVIFESIWDPPFCGHSNKKPQ